MNVEEIVERLASQESYRSLKELKLAIKEGNQQAIDLYTRAAITNSVQAIKQVLLGQYAPLQQLLALRLCKEGVETFNYLFVTDVSLHLLQLIGQIALFDRGNASEDRGRTYFSQNPDRTQSLNGKSILRLSLECIFVWANQFPNDFDSPNPSHFRYHLKKTSRTAYEGLLQEKIIFPKELTYFKQGDLERFNGVQSAVIHRQPQPDMRPARSEILHQKEEKVLPQRNETQTSVQRGTPGQDTPNGVGKPDIDRLVHDLFSKSLQLRKDMIMVCTHNKEIPTDQFEPIIVRMKAFLEESNNVLSHLLDGDYEDLFSRIFDEQQWIEKAIEDYQKLGQQFGVSWSQYQANFVAQSQEMKKSAVKKSQSSQNSRMNDTHFTKAERDQLEGQLKTLEKENNLLQTELQKHTETMEALLSQVEKQANQIQQIQFENTQLRKKSMESSTHAQLKSQLEKVQLDLSQANRKTADTQEQLEETLTENRNLKAQLTILNNQLQQTNTELEGHKHNRQEQEAQIIYQLKEQILKLQKSNEEALKAKEKQLKQCENDLELIQQENFNLQKQFSSALYEQQYQKNLRSTTGEKKQNLTSDLADDLKSLRKNNEELHGQVDQLAIQLVQAQDQIKLNQAETIEKDHHIFRVEEKLKITKRDNEVLNKQIQLLTEQVRNPHGNASYSELLRNYHQSIEDQQRLEDTIKLSMADLQAEYEQKINELTLEKDQLNDQMYKMLEENTLLIKENEKLRDADHHQQMASGKKMLQSQTSSVIPEVQHYLQSQVHESVKQPASGQKEQRKQRFPDTFNFSSEEIALMKLQTEEAVDQEQYIHVIFPHATPKDYYGHKVLTAPKGTVVDMSRVGTDTSKPKGYLHQLLDKIQHIQHFIPRAFGINGMIVKTEIESAAMIVRMVGKGQQLLKICYCVYLFNRTKVAIPVQKQYCQQYTRDGNGLGLRTISNFSDVIEPNQQGRIEIAPYQFENPFELIKLSLQFSDKVRSIYLPISVLQFLDYTTVTALQFKKSWRLVAHNIFRSKPFKYNSEAVINYKVIQYLLPKAVLLNPDKLQDFKIGIDELKFGCICKYALSDQEMHLKIELQPHQTMVIFAACKDLSMLEIIKEILVQMQALLSVGAK